MNNNYTWKKEYTLVLVLNIIYLLLFKLLFKFIKRQNLRPHSQLITESLRCFAVWAKAFIN